jgi:DNA-formamidopyrimidine glycosylase
MPELPEVEVCRRGLAPELEGMRIEGVVIRAPKLRVLIPPELSSLLPGCRVSAVRRRGKYLLLDCQRAGVEGCLIIHLGMSGNLRFVPHDLAPAKHDHFELVLADQILRFADPRRFGVVVWQPGPPEDAERHPLLASQGIEPLSDAFTVDWLFAANSRRSGPIKPVLMDSHSVVGIGNISYLNARYYSSNQGLFTSQDLVFWEMGQSRDGLVALYKPQLQNSYSYAANSPIVNKDPDGRFLDTIADIGFIAYDIYSIGSAYANGQDVSEQISYLGLDVAGAFTPFATGFGAVARTAKVTNKADEAYAVYNLMDKNKNVRYTGITKQNPDTRFKQHLKDPNKAQVVDKIDVVANQPSKTQARLLEQASIEARGGTKGSELLNKRNSISPNSKLYSSAKSSLGSASDAVKRGDYASAIKQLQNVSNDLKKLK